MASAAFPAAVSMASAAFLANPAKAPHKPFACPASSSPAPSAESPPALFLALFLAASGPRVVSPIGVRSSPAMCDPSSASSLPTPLAASIAFAA